MNSILSMSSAFPHDTLSRGREIPNVSSGQRVDSAELLQGQKTIHIHHNGSVYRLQATKLGKLILTK